jgi:hypothetical protein
MLQAYLKYGFLKSIFKINIESILVVFVAALAQLTYVLPTWFIAFIAAQTFGFWDILVEFGVV